MVDKIRIELQSVHTMKVDINKFLIIFVFTSSHYADVSFIIDGNLISFRKVYCVRTIYIYIVAKRKKM